MPKDHEKIPPFDVEQVTQSEVQPFTPDQMVRCEECLRANPPVRMNCLYCGCSLPATESTARFQRPTFRPLEQWENAFSNILLPPFPQSLSNQSLEDAVTLLKLQPEQLQQIIHADRPLPLARTATEDEANLVFTRLNELGMRTVILSDKQLGTDDRALNRIRSATIENDSIKAQALSDAERRIVFDQLQLLVIGRLFTKRWLVSERTSRRVESDMVNASEFFADEAVLDVYGGPESESWRIEASSFDFSLLGRRKVLVAGENLMALVNLIRERAPQVEVDESYNAMRRTLDLVWPFEQRTESGGWRRHRFGKYSTSGITESSNEKQFIRYSRLQYYLKLNAIIPKQ